MRESTLVDSFRFWRRMHHNSYSEAKREGGMRLCSRGNTVGAQTLINKPKRGDMGDMRRKKGGGGNSKRKS